MGEIYILYAVSDGVPRYVGQTEGKSDTRRRHHIARALDGQNGAVHDWLRSLFEAGDDAGVHVVQSDVIPADLDMFEEYWISQFADLLNVRKRQNAPTTDTDIGQSVRLGIQSLLKQAGSETC